jgi:hypothetical protein
MGRPAREDADSPKSKCLWLLRRAQKYPLLRVIDKRDDQLETI